MDEFELNKLMDEFYKKPLRFMAAPDNFDNSTSFMTLSMNKHYADFEIKKSQFIKDKIAEKGFGELLETASHRFPKLCQVKQGEWTLWYADNGTPEGQFIIALKDAEFKYKTNEYDAQIAELSCICSDTPPYKSPIYATSI